MLTTYTSKWFALLLVFALALAACGPGPADSGASTTAEPTPTEETVADLLVIDITAIDPIGYTTFANPGGWMVYQGHLETEDRTVEIYPLPTTESEGTFEEYVASWTDEAVEIVEEQDGRRYVFAIIADLPTVLMETANGVRWTIQMRPGDAFGDDANLDEYTDDLMTIALSAEYIFREAGDATEDGG